MRWLPVSVFVLSITAMTGCPSEFGKDGRINKAVHKDMQEQLLGITRCADDLRKEVCGRGQENSDACRKCGGP